MVRSLKTYAEVLETIEIRLQLDYRDENPESRIPAVLELSHAANGVFPMKGKPAQHKPIPSCIAILR